MRTSFCNIILNVIDLSLEVKIVNKISEAMLYEINGGNQDDVQLGYIVGRACKKVWNAAKGAWETVKSWF